MPIEHNRFVDASIRLAIFGIPAAIATLLFINWCDFLFDCGCRPYWAGASSQCNIHDSGSRNCPWCEHEAAAGVAFLGTLGAQLAIAFWPGAPHLGRRLLLALVAFPLVSGVLGVAAGIWTGYWSG